MKIVLYPTPQVLVILEQLLDEGLYGLTLEDVCQRFIDERIRKEIRGRGETNKLSNPASHPSTWSQDYWKILVGQCRSRKELGQLAQLDEKTVKRYLEKHGITPPWSRKK